MNAIVNATHFCIALGKFDGVERLNIYCAVMKKKISEKGETIRLQQHEGLNSFDEAECLHRRFRVSKYFIPILNGIKAIIVGRCYYEL